MRAAAQTTRKLCLIIRLLNYYRVSSGIESSLKFTQSILETEYQVSEEINKLSQLSVYPSTEIAAIKKQFRYFREQQDAGKETPDEQFPMYLKDLELRVTENKLSVLRGRRMEEEDAKAAYKKKIARLKNIDESQSKDPNNFKNQKRF